MLKNRLLALIIALATLLGMATPAVASAAPAPVPAAATALSGHGEQSNVCKTVPYAPPAAGIAPFTKLPFSETISRGSLLVTQAWVVSPDEEPFVDGPGFHNAIDFEFHNRGDKGFNLPIALPNDACVYSGYQAFDCDNLVDGKKVGCGAGLFTEAITDTGWVIQIAHYGWINPKIPFLETVPDGPNGWAPIGIITKSSTQLKPQGVRMKAGEVLGLMGETGITFGYYDNFRIVGSRGIVIPRTPAQQAQKPNWEKGYAQAHGAIYGGRAEGGPRQRNTDPFGWNGQLTPTNDQYNGARPGLFNVKPNNTLYKTRNGKVLYALP